MNFFCSEIFFSKKKGEKKEKANKTMQLPNCVG